MSFLLYIVLSILISFILIQFSKYISPILKITALILSVFILVKIFPIISNDLYRVNKNNFYIRIYDNPNYEIDYENIKQNSIKYVLIKYNNDFFKLYGFKGEQVIGYVPSIDGIYQISFFNELLIKLFLTLPFFLMLVLMFIEDDYFSEWNKMRAKMETLKDKLYIDGAIIKEIKDLRLQLEEMRTRRSKLEKIEEKLNKLKEKTDTESIIINIEELKKNIDSIKEESGYSNNFAMKIAKCNNFIEECSVRLDYEDYKTAIELYRQNIEKVLREKTKDNKTDFHEIINIAFRAKLIDFEMKQNLHWISNLREDIASNRNSMFVNIARMKQLFSDTEKWLN